MTYVSLDIFKNNVTVVIQINQGRKEKQLQVTTYFLKTKRI